MSLEAVLAQVLRDLTDAIGEAGAVVSFDPLPTVLGERTQLGQVLSNLVGNAIKFRKGDGARVHVTASREPGQWRVAVSDNGIGIDAKYFERIFVMFQRLHQRTDYAGTGIGLAICKRVVERHGGHIEVQSQPGLGSTFSFTLPDSLAASNATAEIPCGA